MKENETLAEFETSTRFAGELRMWAAGPNPFAGSAQLALSLPAAGHTRLRLYDGSGRLVRTLINGTLDAGSRLHGWDGLDDHGRRTPPGLYIASLEAGGREVVLKLLRIE